MKDPILYHEKQKFLQSLIYPVLFVITIWMVKVVEREMGWDLAHFGLYPLHFKGLMGIIFAPFIHSDIDHLINNTIPILVLSVAIFYFYREVAWGVILYTWILTGIVVWFGAREAYHIGASGLIYGFASFLFFSGIIRRNINLMAISLLVVFLYGSMIWGIFPIIPDMSWESHLYGGIVGGILSLFYKNYGPQRKKFDWEDEEDEDENGEIKKEDKDEITLKNEEWYKEFIYKKKDK